MYGKGRLDIRDSKDGAINSLSHMADEEIQLNPGGDGSLRWGGHVVAAKSNGNTDGWRFGGMDRTDAVQSRQQERMERSRGMKVREARQSESGRPDAFIESWVSHR